MMDIIGIILYGIGSHIKKKDDCSKNLGNFNPRNWTIGIHYHRYDLGMPFGVSFHV